MLRQAIFQSDMVWMSVLLEFSLQAAADRLKPELQPGKSNTRKLGLAVCRRRRAIGYGFVELFQVIHAIKLLSHLGRVRHEHQRDVFLAARFADEGDDL